MEKQYETGHEMNSLRRLKILFTADHLKFGGAERHLVSVASGLVSEGHEVAVVYMKAYDSLVSDLHACGVQKVVCCNSTGGVDISAIRKLAATIREFQPDVTIATLQYSLAMTVIARIFSRCKSPLMFVCHSMEHVIRSRKDRLRFAVYRHFYKLADIVIFVSDLQRKFFENLGVRIHNYEVIYNGIDLVKFDLGAVENLGDNIRSAYGFSANDFVIGMCAGFREEKCQTDLLKALRQLRDEGVSAKVLLVGDGQMRSQIEAVRDALRLENDVVLCGFQSDVRPYIAACDIMALTSHAETFPISTLEYMALRRPLVASNVGGLSEQIDDGENGLLYPAGDITKLVACLRKLNDKTIRDRTADAGRRRVEEKFSMGEMIHRFSQAICRLCLGGAAK